jgi:hypothetical protein
MVNNIYLNFDALHGDKDHGGVRDGTTLVLWEWCEGDNQRWKIVPWCKFSRIWAAHIYSFLLQHYFHPYFMHQPSLLEIPKVKSLSVIIDFCNYSSV